MFNDPVETAENWHRDQSHHPQGLAFAGRKLSVPTNLSAGVRQANSSGSVAFAMLTLFCDSRLRFAEQKCLTTEPLCVDHPKFHKNSFRDPKPKTRLPNPG